MECYLAIKRSEILLHNTTWISLQNIMLSERIQTQKVTFLYDSIYVMSRRGKSIETESRLVVARGWGEEGMGNDCLMGVGLCLG